MTPPVRAVWRFLRREGGDYVFLVQYRGTRRWDESRVPVERFWGGARRW